MCSWSSTRKTARNCSRVWIPSRSDTSSTFSTPTTPSTSSRSSTRKTATKWSRISKTWNRPGISSTFSNMTKTLPAAWWARRWSWSTKTSRCPTASRRCAVRPRNSTTSTTSMSSTTTSVSVASSPWRRWSHIRRCRR